MEGNGARNCGHLRSSAGTTLKGKENIPVQCITPTCLLPVSSSSAKSCQNCICSSSLPFIRRLIWAAVKKQAGELTINRGYYNSYISFSCSTRNLSSLLFSLFNLGKIHEYHPNLMCVQSHRCASWSVVVLHTALWILSEPPLSPMGPFLEGLAYKDYNENTHDIFSAFSLLKTPVLPRCRVSAS